MEELKENVTEYFISFILNKLPEENDYAKERRKQFAQTIIHEKSSQKIILEALLKLYPIVTNHIVQDKRKKDIEKGLIGKEYQHDSIFLTKEMTQTQYESFINNYTQIQQQVKNLAIMLDKDAQINSIISEKEIKEKIDFAITKRFQSDKLVGLLTEMGGYEPEFFLDIRDISHDTWNKHVEVERLLKEEMIVHERKFNHLDSKYLYKLMWMKERAGLKIQKLEKYIDDAWTKSREDVDRVKMTLQDEYSLQYENYLKEEAVLRSAEKEEPITDLPSALRKIKQQLAARKILEKKLVQADKVIRGIDNKLKIVMEKNKDLNEKFSGMRYNNEKLITSFLWLVDKSRLLDMHREKSKTYVAKLKFEKLAEKLTEGKFPESMTQEIILKKFYDIRESLNLVSLTTNDSMTKVRIGKLLGDLKVEDILQEAEKKSYETAMAQLQQLQVANEKKNKKTSKKNVLKRAMEPKEIKPETKDTKTDSKEPKLDLKEPKPDIKQLKFDTKPAPSSRTPKIENPVIFDSRIKRSKSYKSTKPKAPPPKKVESEEDIKSELELEAEEEEKSLDSLEYSSLDIKGVLENIDEEAKNESIDLDYSQILSRIEQISPKNEGEVPIKQPLEIAFPRVIENISYHKGIRSHKHSAPDTSRQSSQRDSEMNTEPLPPEETTDDLRVQETYQTENSENENFSDEYIDKPLEFTDTLNFTEPRSSVEPRNFAEEVMDVPSCSEESEMEDYNSTAPASIDTRSRMIESSSQLLGHQPSQMNMVTRLQTPGEVRSFKDMLFSILQKNAKLSDKYTYSISLRDLLHLEIDGIKVQNLILKLLRSYFTKKETSFTQTDVESQMEDFSNAYGKMIKSLLKKSQGDKKRDQKVSDAPSDMEKDFCVESLNKYKSLIKEKGFEDEYYNWVKEATGRTTDAVNTYEIEYQIEAQKLGLKAVDNAAGKKLWEGVIKRRIENGEKDEISIYLRGLLGTDLYEPQKDYVIGMFETKSIFELAKTIQKFPLRAVKHKHNLIINRWKKFMQAWLRNRAVRTGWNVDIANNIHDVWYSLATNIKHVKPKFGILKNKIEPFKKNPDGQSPGFDFSSKWEVHSLSPVAKVQTRLAATQKPRLKLMSQTPQPDNRLIKRKFGPPFQPGIDLTMSYDKTLADLDTSKSKKKILIRNRIKLPYL
ncbi:unnamed protein product [Blepharisma stoltei]|uniref:Uncharacterized protein n=1 Tax=Blepharisma stoltei TaxID=1481888 RepID=A0AAU9IN96_9CILI|nr:unnamed protein product [Blepharisma stoltei]